MNLNHPCSIRKKFEKYKEAVLANGFFAIFREERKSGNAQCALPGKSSIVERGHALARQVTPQPEDVLGEFHFLAYTTSMRLPMSTKENFAFFEEIKKCNILRRNIVKN